MAATPGATGSLRRAPHAARAAVPCRSYGVNVRRPCRILGVLVAALVATSSLASGQTTEHSLYVSVLDQAGAPVTGLGNGDFVVREDGRAREVLRVSRATQPIDVAVLVDNSQSAEHVISDIRQAVTAFVQRLAAAQDHVAIVAIADRPTILQDYTSSAAALTRAASRLFPQPGSGTTLLDAIGEASRGLEKRDSERRVIIAITTEGTDFSTPNHQRTLERLKAGGAAFFALVITQPGGGDLTSDEARSRGIVLADGTLKSGGRLELLLSSMALKGKLDEVATELEQQYHVVYGRPGALVPPEKVEISVTRPGVVARGTPAATPARPSPGA